MSDETKDAAGTPEESSKPMSPIEKLRAAAAKKAASSDPNTPAPSEVKSDAPPAPNTGKPMSPLEKLRAAAAQKSAAGEPAAAPKAAPPAPKKAEVKEKPTAPPAPKKPAVKPKVAEGASPSRRFFLLTWLGAAWAFFSGGCAAAVLAGVRFLYPNVLQEPPTVFKIGAPDKFEEGNVYEQWKNDFGVWIVKNEGRLFALRTVCTHLGCTPSWLEAEQKFKCPCHGSGFRKTGMNFEGPAPRPLERFAIMVADDGQVLIDKSKKLQQELGQWTPENNAFLSV